MRTGSSRTSSRLRTAAAALPRSPRVYFEEWDEPMISGIAWVSELIGVAGGVDVFPERAACPLAKDRIIADALEVVRAQPDVILGSWCGKRFRPERVATREGWGDIPAVRSGELHEIKSPEILQPGPAALTDGVDAHARNLRALGRRGRAGMIEPPRASVPSPCRDVCQLDTPGYLHRLRTQHRRDHRMDARRQRAQA